MAINPTHVREVIIQPVLKEHGLWSVEAEELLMMTAAQESKMGWYIIQVDNDKLLYNNALSMWQIEWATFDWLQSKFPQFIAGRKFEELAHDMRLAALVARLRYYVVAEALPAVTEDGYLLKLARYYKKYYNTPLGAATIDETLRNYRRYVQERQGQ